MASHIIVYTKYHSSNDFGGGLEVSTLRITRTGTQASPAKLHVEFEGEEGSVKKAWMFLEPQFAITLARSLLSVAEGYISQSESEVA